ncbi:MAG: efflux RND transporter periplasmic adaptor subunit [Bacteroidales bacterium]|nr:efflux RND transporter periplasmic adaptor subunit [Bacteroidales bacterium]
MYKKHIVCVLTACLFLSSACKEIRKSGKAVSVPVKVWEVTADTAGDIRSYVGMVEADKSVALSFESGGCIQRICVRDGQKVRKGELLAELDNRNALNAYNAAKVTLEQAEDGFRRAESIYKKGSLPEVKWVEIQTQLNQARSVADICKKNLENCKLYAPQNGTIGNRSVEAGMNVMPFQPVMQLLDLSTITVKVSIPENEIAAISAGQQADIRINALDTVFEGSVSEIGVVADPLSHAYPVCLRIRKPDSRLLPGMVGRVSIRLSSGNTRSLEVPMQAVQISNDGRPFVWTYADGKARKVFVETGGFTETGMRITGGLQQGDLVITEGSQKICENTLLQIL